MNLNEEIERDIGFARGLLAELDKIQPPELVRPDVPHGQPATYELAAWAGRVYIYSLIFHVREVLRSTVTLYDAGQLPAIFLCARSLFESAAHAYYVKKHVGDHIDKKNYEAAWDFLKKVNLGSRYMVEKYGENFDGKIELEESPHISKAIATFNEYFNGSKSRQATETYSFLSEFSHPNSFAFSSTIEWKEADQKERMKVCFVKPSMETVIHALSACVLSVLSVLNSGSEFLRRFDDKSLDGPLTEAMKITEI
jgi:hypothetical protein